MRRSKYRKTQVVSIFLVSMILIGVFLGVIGLCAYVWNENWDSLFEIVHIDVVSIKDFVKFMPDTIN